MGLGSLNSQIVEDDVDVLPTFIPLTPALTRTILASDRQFAGALTFGIQTAGGAASVPAVQRELSGLIPPKVQFSEHALARSSTRRIAPSSPSPSRWACSVVSPCWPRC